LTTYFIIFGAAILPDGRASGVLARRVSGALTLAQGTPRRMFLATGGVGRYGPAEAEVIRDLLIAQGAEPAEILIEDQAVDTLQSISLCDTILRRAGDVEQIVPCTSGFHIPRCASMLHILGYPVRVGGMPSDLPHVSRYRWALYVLKEILATPYDIILLLLKMNLTRK
jgi:uncharacterized SAM-binding protein YcdF (DUF218 family)